MWLNFPPHTREQHISPLLIFSFFFLPETLYLSTTNTFLHIGHTNLKSGFFCDFLVFSLLDSICKLSILSFALSPSIWSTVSFLVKNLPNFTDKRYLAYCVLLVLLSPAENSVLRLSLLMVTYPYFHTVLYGYFKSILIINKVILQENNIPPVGLEPTLPPYQDGVCRV